LHLWDVANKDCKQFTLDLLGDIAFNIAYIPQATPLHRLHNNTSSDTNINHSIEYTVFRNTVSWLNRAVSFKKRNNQILHGNQTKCEANFTRLTTNADA